MRAARWVLVPLIVIPLAWLLFQGFGRDPRQVASPLVGRPAPSWTLATLDGEELSSADLVGRPYLVNFWASWCIPACVDEHPVLARAHHEFGDGLTVVGVLYQDDPDDAEAFLSRYGDAGYPHLVDPNGAAAIDFGVTGPPETFFVDADGIVRFRQFGPLTDPRLDEQVALLLETAAR